MTALRDVPDPRCPAGCGRNRAESSLLCQVCWELLPGSFRRDVFATWQEWRQNVPVGGARLRDARRAFEQSSTLAIAQVRRLRAAAGET